ncbi:MAG: metallophosphoesterase family protein [Pseudomonadota bacterium]
MRLLITADLHGNLRQLEWLVDNASTVDAVIVAGDLVDRAGHTPLAEQQGHVVRTLQAARQRAAVLVASGNHDVDEGGRSAHWLHRLAAGGCIVDGATAVFDDVAITLCPWRPPAIAEASLSLQLGHTSVPVGCRWLWVHHEPPHGTAVARARRTSHGCTALRRAIELHAPHGVIAGHVHDAPFHDGGSWLDRLDGTWLVNPGRQPGDTPAHVEIDLDTETMTWRSHGRCEDRALASVPRSMPADAAAATLPLA